MEENQNSPVVAIYDVRGIQDYIFRTNKVKEIIGASLIVDNLVINEFENALQEIPAEKKVLNWQSSQRLQFNTNSQIEVEVLYYGGGNLVALFRTEELAKKVSIAMSKSILQNAYGLSLNYAYVQKTNNYSEDWSNLKLKLSKIKATTPLNKPAGILPVVQYDNVTGLPYSEKDDGKKVTCEAKQKIKKYSEIENIEKDSQIVYAKEFDSMRTSKEEGLIAIVHIDGNSMGQNIGKLMRDAVANVGSDEDSYEKATAQMRAISNSIHKVFEVDAINTVKDQMEEICQRHEVGQLITQDNGKTVIPFRKIISAGDDITFVCNERISLDVVKTYINAIKKGEMAEGMPFSACAGIAIVHSHFPFHKAYEIAEECCQIAKKRAKAEGMVNGKIGNFVDFQYCYSGSIVDLETTRKEKYVNIEGKSLARRPYGIYENEEISEEQAGFSLDKFEENLKEIKSLSRSKAKSLRDVYYETEANAETLLKKLNLKDKVNLGDKAFNKTAEYYDALEFLDIYGVSKGGDKNAE